MYAEGLQYVDALPNSCAAPWGEKALGLVDVSTALQPFSVP